MGTISKPELNQIPLILLPIPFGGIGGPALVITMSTGQAWDNLLNAFYTRGHIVLELNQDEQPIKAYRQQDRGKAQA